MKLGARMPRPIRQLEPNESVTRQFCQCGARMKITHTGRKWRRYRCGDDPTWTARRRMLKRRKLEIRDCNAPKKARIRMVRREFVKENGNV